MSNKLNKSNMETLKELLTKLVEKYGREFNFSLIGDGKTIIARMFYKGTEPEDEEYDCGFPLVFIGLNGISFDSYGWTKLNDLYSEERNEFLYYVCKFGFEFENI